MTHLVVMHGFPQNSISWYISKSHRFFGSSFLAAKHFGSECCVFGTCTDYTSQSCSWLISLRDLLTGVLSTVVAVISLWLETWFQLLGTDFPVSVCHDFQNFLLDLKDTESLHWWLDGLLHCYPGFVPQHHWCFCLLLEEIADGPDFWDPNLTHHCHPRWSCQSTDESCLVSLWFWIVCFRVLSECWRVL